MAGKSAGWKTAAKKPVKNDDLWYLLDEQVGRRQESWHWVKGHRENEIADQLASQGIDQLK